MYNYIMITRNNNGSIVIKAEYNGNTYARITYYFYNKRDAIAKFRRDHGLKYKHLTLIEY